MQKLVDKIKKLNIKVLDKKEDIYPYAFDTAPLKNKITPPLCVCYPKTTEDIQKLIIFASKNGLNIVPRGAATCHTSGCKPNDKSIVLHLSLMDKILDFNKEDLTIKVEPYVTVKKIQETVEKEGLFFPPDPSNLAVSTIGGAVALSSGGPRAFKYGTTKDFVINLKVVLPSGEIIETGSNVAKNVTGYNLTQLFTGSEGTLGVISEVTLKLIPKPEKRRVTLCYFDTLLSAAKGVNDVINALIVPSTLDLLDKNTLQTIEKYNPTGLLCDKEAALLIEVDGSSAKIEEDNKKLYKVLQKSGAVKIIQSTSEEENEKIWKARRSAYAAVTKIKPNVATEDVVVNRSKIVPLVEGIQEISAKYNITVCIMGHAGDGNIHPNFALVLSDEKEKENFEKVKEELFKLAIELGGSLSGEHGIGSEKKPYLDFALQDTALKYMKEIKKLFDPNNIMNPDKMF